MINVQFRTDRGKRSAPSLPSVTLAVVLLQACIHRGNLRLPISPHCLAADRVLDDGEWTRMFLAAFYHPNDTHLIMTLVSFIYKAYILASFVGAVKFLSILLKAIMAVGVMQVGLAFLLSAFFNVPEYYKVCTSTFAGVVLALKMINHGRFNVDQIEIGYFILNVPPSSFSWLECILLYAADPRSPLPLLSGALVGFMIERGALSSRPFNLSQGIKSIPTYWATYLLLSLLITTYSLNVAIDPCCSYRAVFRRKRFLQLTTPSLYTLNVYHLIYVVLSLHSLGKRMEPKLGHYGFLYNVFFIVNAVNLVFCGLTYWLSYKDYGLSQYLPILPTEDSCFSGFTGALLTLKILHHERNPGEKYSIASFPFSVPYWCGVALEVVHLYFYAPKIWLIGHVGAVLVGLAHVTALSGMSFFSGSGWSSTDSPP
ncbi:uncharacterized protein LOC135389988 [Ornithodoros turicata]|uniref:uncharacterized protein LOC135389988 n=1 Tax=Ornithodoros turicata TaxID=34597 RepID=UPI0031398E24